MKILSFDSLNCDYTYEVDHFLVPKETLAARSMQRGFDGAGHAVCHKSGRNRRAAQRCGCIHPGNQRTEMKNQNPSIGNCGGKNNET